MWKASKRWLQRAGLIMALSAMTGGAHAQISLPGGVGGRVGDAVGQLGDRLGETVGDVTRPVTDTLGTVAQMAQARLSRLDAFVRGHRASVEVDDTGQPARAHEVLLLDPDPAALASAASAGFGVIDQGDLGGLGVAYARLSTPADMALASALRRLRHLLPGKEVSADQIHFTSGSLAPGRGEGGAAPQPRGGTVGIIDGGVTPGARIVAQAGFASGGPHPNAHAQAIASLLAGAGTARTYVADVYGTDPAGGNALAIARALAWMAGQHVPVVSISLVGPANPLLARAIGAAQSRGMIVTAAVGNDGAAAPPAFPASYDGVIAVTGVDGHGRVLFEAGHASHLDYAAPGADMTAIGLRGKVERLRGTSFAAPLVAARIAALDEGHASRQMVLRRADGEAVGASARTGRGILCGACRKGI
ncbi:MAG: S8 family serine peptidase [Sphingomonadales bacterium]|nr:S8 family serine peptidase [Sphingomonadales bacterium]MDE2168396.1 S8 family serine peptidase [Sphingomonadales bacterium]